MQLGHSSTNGNKSHSHSLATSVPQAGTVWAVIVILSHKTSDWSLVKCNKVRDVRLRTEKFRLLKELTSNF
jgi:hypothetical protein